MGFEGGDADVGGDRLLRVALQMAPSGSPVTAPGASAGISAAPSVDVSVANRRSSTQDYSHGRRSVASASATSSASRSFSAAIAERATSIHTPKSIQSTKSTAGRVAVRAAEGERGAASVSGRRESFGTSLEDLTANDGHFEASASITNSPPPADQRKAGIHVSKSLSQQSISMEPAGQPSAGPPATRLPPGTSGNAMEASFCFAVNALSSPQSISPQIMSSQKKTTRSMREQKEQQQQDEEQEKMGGAWMDGSAAGEPSPQQSAASSRLPHPPSPPGPPVVFHFPATRDHHLSQQSQQQQSEERGAGEDESVTWKRGDRRAVGKEGEKEGDGSPVMGLLSPPSKSCGANSSAYKSRDTNESAFKEVCPSDPSSPASPEVQSPVWPLNNSISHCSGNRGNDCSSNRSNACGASAGGSLGQGDVEMEEASVERGNEEAGGAEGEGGQGDEMMDECLEPPTPESSAAEGQFTNWSGHELLIDLGVRKLSGQRGSSVEWASSVTLLIPTITRSNS